MNITGKYLSDMDNRTERKRIIICPRCKELVDVSIGEYRERYEARYGCIRYWYSMCPNCEYDFEIPV